MLHQDPIDKISVGIAIPLYKEKDCIHSLLKCLSEQTFLPTTVSFCINQPETNPSNSNFDFCQDSDYLNNYETEKIILNTETPFLKLITDHYSPGKQQKKKNLGVGYARKAAANLLVLNHTPIDILIFMDADTLYPKEYIKSVIQNFHEKPTIDVISIPYYHLLTSNDSINRAILRYEIYLRWTAINSLKYKLPFSFTAFGSAIACRTSSYIKFGEMSTKPAGEDFYFLQKVVKQGILATWNPISVFPSSRISNRVIFGTGPAIASGPESIAEQYPLFYQSSFSELESIFQFLNQIDQYASSIANSNQWPDSIKLLMNIMSKEKIEEFLQLLIESKRPLKRLIKEKLDALKIAQYLKARQIFHDSNSHLTSFSKNLTPLPPSILNIKNHFNNTSTEELNRVRNTLYHIELKLRMKEWQAL